MEVKEIEALNDLREVILQVNGAISRLGKDKGDMVIVLPKDDWNYFNNVLSSGVSSFSNFYIKINDNEFTLSGIQVQKIKES